jgi:hypothetical protein
MNQDTQKWLDELYRIYVTHDEYPPATAEMGSLIAIARAAFAADAACYARLGPNPPKDELDYSIKLGIAQLELHEALHGGEE